MPFVNPFKSETVAPPIYFEAGSLCREKTKQEMMVLDACVGLFLHVCAQAELCGAVTGGFGEGPAALGGAAAGHPLLPPGWET